MKLASLFISATLFASPFAVAGQEQGVLFDSAFALVAEGGLLRPGHSLKFAAVSDQCEAEIESLSENNDLMAAAEALGESCPVSTSGNTITVDFGSCRDLGKFQLACTSAGGKMNAIRDCI